MVDRRPPSSPVHPRHGFSLLELLVALTIVVGVLTLTIGGLVRGRDSNRLLAAEHMIADSIRQARHAARSSGAPVELRLRPVIDNSQVVGATIAGVSRIPIWSERFDNNSRVIGSPGTDTDTALQTIGRSGNGRRVDLTHTVQQPLTAREQLVRSGRSDGFYLSCAVLPPAVGGGGNTIQPLLLIGAGGDRLDASQCGLSLQNPQRLIDTGANLPTWEILGWVRSGSSLIYVSSLDNVPTDVNADQPLLPSGNQDAAIPLAGGTWVEIGLLYDGERLVLYRDGQRVGEQATGVPRNLQVGDRLYVGQTTLLDSQTPPVPVQTFAGAVFDDVRLDRLGTDQLGQLPRGIVLIPAARQPPTASLSYRIVAHPDGRVEVLKDATPSALNLTTPATIIVGQRFATGTGYATITIANDGRVTSALTSTP